MVRGDNHTFTVKIQNHGNERMTVEIPKDVRKDFRVGSTVKISIKELM